MKLPLTQPTNMGKVSAWWSSSEPFVINKRAHLVHRPRYVAVYNLHELPHIAVMFLCGMGVTDNKKRNNLEFVDSLDDEAILCRHCEARAISKGLPSANELTGQHVHIGGMVVVKECCK